MVAVKNPPGARNFKLPNFSLLGVDGEYHSSHDLAGKNGTIVMFICNHCAYVKAIIKRLVNDVAELQEHGINAIAINSNDPIKYPEDSFENMSIFSKLHNIFFPYCFDEDQEVARHLFDARCTPEFWGFNGEGKLRYRGRFDSSGIEDAPNAKHELKQAMIEIAQTGDFIGTQNPSIGCSIKWRSSAA